MKIRRSQNRRCNIVAAVFAVFYIAFLSAMDLAGRENISYAQSIVTAVGVMAASIDRIVGTMPASESRIIQNGLVAKLQKEVENNNKEGNWEGALRWCLIEILGICISMVR
jgi:hypothetical protein